MDAINILRKAEVCLKVIVIEIKLVRQVIVFIFVIIIIVVFIRIVIERKQFVAQTVIA